MTVRSLARRSALCLALAFAFNLTVPAGHAVSAKKLEKQARKIEAKLAKYPKGAFLEFHFRDGSRSTGSLGTLSEHSFSFTNSDTNGKETHNYSDVTKVKKGKTYIGTGSEKHHRFHIPFFHWPF
jgi:hypothetical protein